MSIRFLDRDKYARARAVVVLKGGTEENVQDILKEYIKIEGKYVEVPEDEKVNKKKK